uniref:Helitron_like_N domain-containing protein n=1 Tax=Caenorhabditis japonica TaxID=281687 RepID=A0A8R1EFI0_CAEJA
MGRGMDPYMIRYRSTRPRGGSVDCFGVGRRGSTPAREKEANRRRKNLEKESEEDRHLRRGVEAKHRRKSLQLKSQDNCEMRKEGVLAKKKNRKDSEDESTRKARFSKQCVDQRSTIQKKNQAAKSKQKKGHLTEEHYLGSMDKECPGCGALLFKAQAALERMGIDANKHCDSNTMENLSTLLAEINPYAKSYKMMAQVEEVEQKVALLAGRPAKPVLMIFDINTRELDLRRYNLPTEYQDAVCIVAEREKPDCFLTFTCNPRWREVTENLKPGQQPPDRPDLIARVFKLKADHFFDVLLKQHWLRKVISYIQGGE